MPDLGIAKDNFYDWYHFYPGLKEDIPINIPAPCGKELHVTMYVNFNHSGDLINNFNM